MTENFVLSEDDVRNWAEFSGDWNPLHFDVNVAHAFGAKTIFAHGMLSMLPTKISVSKFNDCFDAGGWLRFDVKLREPTPVNEIVKVVWEEPKNNKCFGELRSLQENVVLSYLTFSKHSDLPTNTQNKSTNHAKISKKQISNFFDLTISNKRINTADLWVCLDAIMVSEFIKISDISGEGSAIKVVFPENYIPHLVDPMLVHSRHTVYINSQIMLAKNNKIWDFENCEFTINVSEPVVKKNGASGFVSLQLDINEKPVLRCDIVLTLKGT